MFIVYIVECLSDVKNFRSLFFPRSSLQMQQLIFFKSRIDAYSKCRPLILCRFVAIRCLTRDKVKLLK